MIRRRTLLAAPALLGPAGAFAQTRPTLRVQTIGGALEKAMRDEIIPAFERNGTTVALTVEDDVAMLPKVQVARGRPPYDVVMMDNDKGILGQQLELWAPDQSARFASLPESARPPATAIYSSIVFEYGLAYTPAKMPAPASWADLWAAPGITVAVPHISQAYGWSFLYTAALLHGGSDTNLEPGFAAIKRLPRIKIYRNVSQGLSLFQQGEVDAGLFYANRIQQMMEGGLALGRATPREGVWGIRTGLQVPRGAANMEGALAFIEHVSSAASQSALARAGYSPVNKQATIPPEFAARLVPASRVDAVRELPWATLLPQRDAVLDRWNREFA